MNTTEQKSKFSWHNITLAVIFFALGYLSFSMISSLKNQQTSKENFDLFWQVWSTVEDKYPFEEPTDSEKVYGAIEGLVATYDDNYSTFLPPVKSEFFNQTISGEFGGIGAEIAIESGYLTVVSPLKDSPAEKSGLKPGDIITHVDGTDISGKTLDEAISFIRGEIKTSVTLTVLRYGQSDPLEIKITRDIVTIPIIDTEVIDDVFVIHLYNFNEMSEVKFKKAIADFKKSDKSNLLIDLRNNPGGYLTSAVDIASYFLPQGAIVLREQFGETDTDETVYRSHGYELLGGMDFETKILVNLGSASASEILAGALSDNNVATIVGERTYGKGSVQELIDLPGDTSVKITVAKWLTPERNQISEIGIEPDLLIEISETVDADEQLRQAVKSFNN